MIRKLISLVVLVVIAVVGLSLLSNKESALNDSDTEIILSEQDQVEHAIESYLEDKNKKGFLRSRFSFFVCKAHNMWEGSDREGNTLVYAAHACLSMIPSKDKGVEEESGLGLNAALFKLNQANNGRWSVIDADDRMFPKEEAKDWVLEYMDQVPQSIIDKVDTHDSIYTEIANEAKKHFRITQ